MIHTYRPAPAARKAFTLVELITVIAVMAILIAIGVPAFRAALSSSDKSLAENQFRIGMELARQVAIQNSSRDAAAVFFFEPGGRLTIVPCIYVGTLVDQLGTGAQARSVDRDIFVPVPEVAPVQLPRGWMVRGFAPPGSLATPLNECEWYETQSGREHEGQAAGTPVGNWVFPETGFYANGSNTVGADAAEFSSQGDNRQSFMVRYKAGTGQVDPSESRLCLVVDAVPSEIVDGTTGALSNWRVDGGVALFSLPSNRIDLATDKQRFVKRLLAIKNVDAQGGVDENDDVARRDLIGGRSSDTVLCRPLTELALYKEQSLASALGARGLNAFTGSIYGDPTGNQEIPEDPQVDTRLFPPTASLSTIAHDINYWITGRLPAPGGGGEFVESDAKLFAIDRYLGQGRKLGDAREVTP